MNILLVTNNLYPTGGDWTYVDSVAKLYKAHGHNVYLFGQRNEKNVDQSFEKYYVKAFDKNEKNKLKLAFQVLTRTIYCKEAESKMEQFLKEFNIDVVQLNSFNIGLTPSIINAIDRANIPMVWRVIEYKTLCPNIYLMRNGTVCEECMGGKFYNCVKHRCKNGSLLQSIAVALETYVYSKRKEYSKVTIRSYQNYFTRDLYKRFGVDTSNSVVEVNPYDPNTATPNYTPGEYVLYFGRLVRPKGVMTILKAAELTPDIKYVIVGTGDLEDDMARIVKEKNLSNVDLRGPAWGKDMDAIIQNCRFVISASEWYEPSSYVALQSFANGKPVIASHQGGVKEIVKDGYSGLLFETGNPEDLAHTITKLYNDLELVETLGRNGRHELETEYSPEGYYERTIALFEKLIREKKHDRL